MPDPSPHPDLPPVRRRRWRPLRPRREYYARLARCATASAALVGGALLVGAVGYHLTERMPWLDALYAAAMILTGMGPTEPLHTSAGKIFATVYALLSALVFLSAATLLLAPMARRFLHRFHLELEEEPPAPHS